ncbi:MAG: right-handed parallel beta-helix repeat-containing protein [Spirochaetes bacterium]|nr:right-handed parallel beta-helix repeat-containing protein [Spirochaetota bacterium]
MRKVIACLLAAGILSSAELFVAVNGNDADPGTKDKPLQTIERARDIARTKKSEPVTVNIRGGNYFLEKAISFSPDDSGTRTAPRIYRSALGETAVLIGGRPVRGWSIGKGGIYKADLKVSGISGQVFHQLFYNNRRMVIARYPNVDPKHPITGGFLYMPLASAKPNDELPFKAADLSFASMGDRSQAEVVAYTKGGWTFSITPILEVDDAKSIIKVRKVRNGFSQHDRFYVQNIFALLDAPNEWYHDRVSDTLYFYPPDGKKPSDDSVIVPLSDNIIEVNGTLDSPYEYLDIKNQVSYEENRARRTPKTDNPVSYITFMDISLMCAEQSGIRMVGARHVNVISCEVSHIGNYGINLGGVAQPYDDVGNPRRTPLTGVKMGVSGAGQDLLFNDGCRDCRIAGNDIFSTGAEGIMLHGADNVAENNHVYECGIFDKDMANINQFGERNVIRRNTMHDSPRSGAFQKGVSNIIELNDIRQTQREARDGGGIRMCQRNVRIGGNVIRYNRIVDTIGYGHENSNPFYYSPYYQWGVYLDDFTAGTSVYGNIIARASRGGVHVHGGSDNIVSNNIIVDCPYGVEANSMGENQNFGAARQQNTVIVNNIIAYTGDPAYARLVYEGIPFGISAGTWYDGLISACYGNIYWMNGAAIRMKPGTAPMEFDIWREQGCDRDSVTADPLFVNSRNDEYRLEKRSPAYAKGFSELPYDEIGCYKSEERARWPLEKTMAPRETPFFPIPVETIMRSKRELAACFTGKLAELYELGNIKIFSEGGTSIKPYDETMTGKPPVLAFIDKPGPAYDPRLMINLRAGRGTARLSFMVKLDEKKPAPVIFEARQYSDIPNGAKPDYIVGAFIDVRKNGNIDIDGSTVAAIAPGAWASFSITFVLGSDVPMYDLAVSGAGASYRGSLKKRDARFTSLERILIYNTEKIDGVFYIDDLSLKE